MAKKKGLYANIHAKIQLEDTNHTKVQVKKQLLKYKRFIRNNGNIQRQKGYIK